ncbi:hypothetical protein WR25_03272 [Diploscapter pachys]|uniref:Uncharacterized protein n=1 Tax=Diploscapter pachys TaxID=2018661 RepID=A0A2A2JQF5_9BILA|nr:hypothetical protein WR25_03272 [Diploscapter pachys]
MPRLPHHTKIGLVTVGALIIFGFYSNLNTISFCPTQPVIVAKTEKSIATKNQDAQKTKTIEENYQEYASEDSQVPESLLPHHPFDNLCRFPLVATYPEDLSSFRVGERLRQLKCPIESYPLASIDSEGYLYIHNHFEHYGNVTEGVNCSIIILEGGLRDPKTNKGKDTMNEVKTFQGIENMRLWVNADAYTVRCMKKDQIVWEKAFPGMRDITKEKNTLTVAKDIPEFDDYGRKLKQKPRKMADRYSIDILGFDSTARSMFFRHLPRTVDTMNRLGFHFFYGYNKIGDNSMINLGPILAGDLPEIANEPQFDVSGDINADWLMPQHRKLDPTNLPFLWKMMKEKFGCRSMLNEDISMKHLGLFHYPSYEFLPGFTESPADHFYRVYYLAVYDKWRYSQCKNGDQIQKEFVDLWYRFSHQYRDICHFGFTFMTTLTHEAGLTLEPLDEYLAGRLAQLHLSGALDNTLSIVMGDHGNRIGLQQFSYSGRIEERMPLLAVRLPNNFSRNYPVEYGHFIKNKYKLVRYIFAFQWS